MVLKALIISSSIFLLFSCKPSTKNKNVTSKGSKEEALADNSADHYTYNTHIDLNDHSKYVYSIINETATEVEINGRSVNGVNKTAVEVTYEVQKDSAGNFILHTHYDKIQLHTKNGENETTFNAAHAAAGLNPTERMLGLLQNATISATINAEGKVLAINGYKELGEKIVASVQ